MRGVAVTGAVTLVTALALFGASAWGGAFVADPTIMRDTYHVSAILETYGGHLGNGDLPLWLPEVAGGAPAYATWIYGMLSPAILLWAALPASAAWTWSAILHMVLAATGLHVYLRVRGLRVEAAMTGALLLAFSEFAIARTTGGHLNLFWPLAWTPWVLVGIDAAARGRKGGVPGLALASAFALVSGHVQMWFFLGPLCAAIAVVTAREAGGGRALLRVVAGAALAVVMTAFQWLPTAEYASLAARVEIEQGLLDEWSTAPYLLAEKIMPGILGTRPETRWAPGGYENESAMIGGLAVFGIAALGFRWRDRQRVVWGGATLVALIVSIGQLSPATQWISAVPPFSWARVAGRALVVPALALPVLAAYGADTALRASAAEFKTYGRRAVATVGVLALGTMLGLRLWTRTLAWPHVVGGEMWAASRTAEVAVPAMLWSMGGLLIVAMAVLEVRRSPQRALALPAAALIAALFVAPRVDSVDDAFYRDAGANLVPAQLREHRILLRDHRVPYPEPGGVATFRPLSHVGTRWMHALSNNITPATGSWLAIAGELAAPGLPPGPPVDLAQRARFLPVPWPIPERARIYVGAHSHADEVETLAGVQSGADELWLDDGHDHPRGGRMTGASANILPRDDPRTVEVDVDAPEDGWLLVTESYYPGWFTDFPWQHVQRANVNFRSVRIDAGKQRVAMRFRPISFYAGLAISALGLLVTLQVLRRDRRRRT